MPPNQYDSKAHAAQLKQDVKRIQI